MAMLSFDQETGQIEAPETSTIRGNVAADFVSAFNLGDGSPSLDTSAVTPAGQLVDAITAYIAQSNSELMYVKNQFNPLTAEGAFQDALGAIYFLTRKIADPTKVDCVCTGLQGTVIPAGAIVQDESGNRYQATTAATIPAGGSVTVTFSNIIPGPVDCPANTVTNIVTVIAGWDTVNNPASGTLGRLQESQSDFEKRRFNSVAANAQGSAMALQGALDNLEGVVDCLVLENTSSSSQTLGGVSVDGHSVAICIYPNVAGIAETIYQKKSAGCGTTGTTQVVYTDSDTGAVYTYNIIVPTTLDVKVVVNVDYSLALPATYISDIKEAIIADFNGQNTDSGNSRIGMGQTVYASRFTTAVLLTAGIRSLRSITIALGTGAAGDSITIPANIQPVMSEADITVNAITV